MIQRRILKGASILAIVSVLLPSLLLSGCGGRSGGNGGVTTKSVSSEIARATQAEGMHAAFAKVRSLTSLDEVFTPEADSQQPINESIREAFAIMQLTFTEDQYLTFGQLYAIFNDNDKVGPNFLGMTAIQAVQAINARLPGAYADPDRSANATLILLSSRAGNIPASAPTLTVDTRLSPVQQLMAIHHLAKTYTVRTSCTMCYVQYAGMIAAILVFTTACGLLAPWFLIGCAAGALTLEAAATFYLASCLESCHSQ